ncbi:MAG: hypothetical protein K2H87_08560, partial [Duncaniella sp.]|nr:hypothetical protein [Duncaniella sp.]
MRLRNLILPFVAAMGMASATAAAPARAPFIHPKKHVANTAPAKGVSEVPAKKAYAWVTRDRASLPLGIASFMLNNPAQLTSEFPMQNSAYSGCFANGKYYFDRYRSYMENGQSTWAHIAFSSVDLTTGAVTNLADWSDEYFVMNDMAYDYTTGTLYAMCRNMYIDDFLTGFYFEYSGLFAINTTTGVATEVKQFIDWGNGTLTNPTYYTLACDLNGTLYSINQNGSLVYFDRANDFAEVVIGDTGVNPAKTTQSMEFDHTTGTLYWAADYSDKVAELLTVDVATGRASLVGATGSDSHLVGLYIPFDLPSEAAPGAVTDYSVTAAADGAKTASLTFTTPVKSFGGATLASITSVKILRNDQEIKSFASPGIGKSISFEDAVSESGLYSYTVVPYNAAGAGLASGISLWVGKDIPAEVTNIGIGATDEGHAYLEWVAPVKGVHGGVIDEATLGYKITRYPDGVIVAQDARGTSFTDTTIPGIGRYYYSIESHTADGVGNVARSIEIAIGNGIVTYPWNTLFADVSEFNLWTVVDANGGSTWQWKSRTAGGYNAMAMYAYDNKN